MSSSELQVIQVTTESDRAELYRLRYDIFIKEQSKYVAVADHRRKILVDELDSVAAHFAVVRQGSFVASMRILHGADKATAAMQRNLSLAKFSHIEPNKISFCGRLLVLPAYRGTAALLHLIQHCYRVSCQRGTKVDIIFCNPHLVRMYEQLGYRRYRTYFEDPDLGFQIPMALILDDIAHLKLARSPFYKVARSLPCDPDLTEWFKATFPGYQSFVSPISVGADRFMEIMSSRINAHEVGLLRGLDDAERATLVAATTHLEIAAGTKLIRKGDLGKELYVILDGVAEVRMPMGDGSLLLATLGRGDIFGEMSLVSTKPRSADVIAQTPLEVVFFDDDCLNRLVKTQPSLAAKLLYNLSRTLAERLEITSQQLAVHNAPDLVE